MLDNLSKFTKMKVYRRNGPAFCGSPLTDLIARLVLAMTSKDLDLAKVQTTVRVITLGQFDH